MSLFDRIKTGYKNNPWRGRIIITLLALVCILGLARLLLPQTIIYSSTSWLKKQGIDASIEAININIIDGTVSLVNAEGRKHGQPLFNIGLVDIYWHWAPLSEKTIVVTKVGLDELSINIDQYTDKIIIGGVTIPVNNASTDEAEEIVEQIEENDEKTKPWAASLGEVIFTNLNVCYLQHTAPFKQASADSLYVDYCVALQKMSWAGTISYATDSELLKTDDIPLSSTGDFMLEGLTITDNRINKKLLVSQANTLDNVVITGLNRLKIDLLKMNDLSLLQRDDEKHSDSIRFHQLTIDDIELSSLNTLAINNIYISKPGVYLVKQNQIDWEYQDWIPRSSTAENYNEKPNDNKQAESESSFKIALNNISINHADLCYLDKLPSLYYCLTFAELDWRGSIKYNTVPEKSGDVDLLIAGDLKLSEQHIHNQTIDRNLTRIQSLILSKLKISGTKDITLEKLGIENFTALQRSKNKDDNTAAFDKLAIDDIKYTPNKVDINSIDISGLSNVISKNKNGKWEHDKWQPKDKTAKAAATDAESKTDIKEPFIVSLNKLKLSSEKNIIFTDNSTEPAMKVGLQSIKANIENIHNDKPETNSRFKLYAKTIRHSTIDIEGTAKLFAEKISFDADGKLKGFDLRAASPATQKAIGHIIRSGQMDANLKLLAVDGVLDSNIELALYHFNIKASSKEDAKKLDAKFGMPLNQTLLLLRDKDDSIHLDIPVTGDVNSPSFEPMDAIVKATSKAATVTLITFYTPYGLVYAGGNLAFNLATALNFDPIDFKPGSSELQTDNKEQLSGLSKLMTEKPNVHLTLCGVTNQQDLFTLYPDLKNELASNKKGAEQIKTEITLTKEQSTQLEQLARKRQINTKNYLVNENGIAHDRLILCAPEHKTDNDAVAGVEIII